MTWTIYVEGGGRGKDLRTRCRQGFHDFLSRLDLAGRRPKIVACGKRTDAFKRFKTAMETDPMGRYALLVDSEVIVDNGRSVWHHVAERSGDVWTRPKGAEDGHLHFMAVCMESWIAADGRSLARLYGQGFRIEKLPRWETDIERLDKATILQALQAATRGTTIGEYTKGKVSFSALGAVDVGVVSERMPFCKRFARLLVDADDV